ncbi:MAG: hypothetical protein HBSAPP03_14390 [Phycisphaerae bacterium]|nr:MAG: hypothetical protein HBSAPP03_14390 [Phycisphaerae bacterium]
MPDRRDESDKPLMRAIGEFFGEVWKGVKTDPSRPGRVTRRHVEERTADTPDGKVVLRRTIVEEIIVPPPGRAE